MMEQIITILLSSFDFGYMFSVNILTYLIIKIIDELNGPKAVPTWLKRLVAVACGVILAAIICLTAGWSNTIIYSFILSLVTWDTVFKPVLKYFKHLDYKKDGDNTEN